MTVSPTARCWPAVLRWLAAGGPELGLATIAHRWALLANLAEAIARCTPSVRARLRRSWSSVLFRGKAVVRNGHAAAIV